MTSTDPMLKAATNDTKAKPRRRRGFAVMDPELVRRLGREGGRAAHERGTAHEFTPEEAQVAGRKGGLATRRRRATK